MTVFHLFFSRFSVMNSVVMYRFVPTDMKIDYESVVTVNQFVMNTVERQSY